jgi:hypothetical protein
MPRLTRPPRCARCGLDYAGHVDRVAELRAGVDRAEQLLAQPLASWQREHIRSWLAGLHDGCPRYVAPAPWWLRALTWALSRGKL